MTGGTTALALVAGMVKVGIVTREGLGDPPLWGDHNRGDWGWDYLCWKDLTLFPPTSVSERTKELHFCRHEQPIKQQTQACAATAPSIAMRLHSLNTSKS